MAAKKLGLFSFNVGTTVVVEEFKPTGDIGSDLEQAPRVDPRTVFLAFGAEGDIKTPLLDDNKINLLLSLENPPGSGNKLFDFEVGNKAKTLTMIGEFGQLLIENGFEKAYSELLSFCSNSKDDFTWETTSLNQEKARVDFINEMEVKVEARDDIGICNKCKSKWLTQSQIQNRASDEALKTTYKCAKCNAGKHYLTIF